MFCAVAGMLLGFGGLPLWRTVRSFILRRPEGIIVRGRIFKGGAPVKSDNPTETTMMEIYLLPMSEAGYADVSEIATDGSFEFVGMGNGVPPGKYKIAVEIMSDFGAPDQLKGKFSQTNSPIVRVIGEGGNQDLGIIDQPVIAGAAS